MAECVIAYIGEGELYGPLVDAAEQAARERGARLIVYDADAASRFASPLPTWWSADGEEEEFGSRLSPNDLERAGQQNLRWTVVELRSKGLDAYGWLPSNRGAGDFADYARQQKATLLVVPEELVEDGLVEELAGDDASDEELGAATSELLVFDLEHGTVLEPESNLVRNR